MGAKVHPGAVPPAEEWLTSLGLTRDEILRGGYRFIVDDFHSFFGEWTEVLDRLATLAVCLALQNSPRSKLLKEGFAVRKFSVSRVVAVLWFFLGVEVVKGAEKFIETVHRGQVLVAVTLVILAELAGGITLAFEDRGDGAIGLLLAFGGARQADFGHTGANRHRTADESCTADRAALLRVVVGERQTFLCDAVNVRRRVAHHSTIVVADVPSADVIAPNNENVWLLLMLGIGRSDGTKNKSQRADRGCGPL